MSDEKKLTPDETRAKFEEDIRPLMDHLVRTRGVEFAKRAFARAIEAAGLDPLKVRCVFPEDIH